MSFNTQLKKAAKSATRFDNLFCPLLNDAGPTALCSLSMLCTLYHWPTISSFTLPTLLAPRELLGIVSDEEGFSIKNC